MSDPLNRERRIIVHSLLTNCASQLQLARAVIAPAMSKREKELRYLTDRVHDLADAFHKTITDGEIDDFELGFTPEEPVKEDPDCT